MPNALPKNPIGVTPLQISSSFEPLKEFGHVTQQAIMPIIAIADEEIIPLGTGFAIGADGYILTAKHVIQSFSTPKVLKSDGRGYYRNFSLWVIQLTGQKHKSGSHKGEIIGGPRPISKVWYSSELDMAVCALTPAENNRHNRLLRLPCLRLGPGIPKIGENILGFGYYQSSGEMTTQFIDGKRLVNYSQNTAFTRGKITDIYFPRRDSAMLNFPCFQTDARFEPGMSGGPVFKENGSVCGVICSAGLNDTDGNYISNASLIWPVLGTTIEVNFKKGDPIEKITLYELVKRKYIGVDDSIEQVEVTQNPDGTRSISIRKAVSSS